MEVDGVSLLDALPTDESDEMSQPQRLRLELHVYAMTPDHQLAGSWSHRIRLPISELREPLAAGGVRFAGHLELPTGDFELRLLALEPKSQRFALRHLDLTVPASLTPPLFPDADTWIQVREPGAAPPTGIPAIDRPAALPVLRAGQTHLLWFHNTNPEAIPRSARWLPVSEADAIAAADTVSAQALEALCELESQTLAASEDRLRSRTWMKSGQERVIEQLAATEPESLIPLLALHVAAHDRYVKQPGSDPFLPGSSRERSLMLAEVYTRQAPRAVGRSLAASALAEVGVAIDRAGLWIASRRMLEESLTLDPDQASTLLYLAYWHQRRAATDDAVPLLRQLLAVAPQSLQGKLRLAHGLAQQGQTSEADRLLRQVLHQGGSDWMLTIAYQELARLLLAQQRDDEAVSLLAGAVAHLPSQQRLRIQLAYALDRVGKGHRGSEIVTALPADRGRPSPRNLYSQRPQTAGNDGRQALQRRAMARLPLLTQALDQTKGSR